MNRRPSGSWLLWCGEFRALRAVQVKLEPLDLLKTSGYTFFTTSDDGSILEIDGQLIVNNDGNHGFEEKEGKCFLEKGYHKVKLLYFDSGGGNNLLFSYQPIGLAKTEVPATILFH